MPSSGSRSARRRGGRSAGSWSTTGRRRHGRRRDEGRQRRCDGLLLLTSAGRVDDSDPGLTPPINTGGNTSRTISHVDFCLDPKDDTGIDDLSSRRRQQASWSRSTTGTIDKSVDKPPALRPAGRERPSPTGRRQRAFTWRADRPATQEQSYGVTGTITVENRACTEVSTGVEVTDSIRVRSTRCDGGRDNCGETGAPGSRSPRTGHSVLVRGRSGRRRPNRRPTGSHGESTSPTPAASTSSVTARTMTEAGARTVEAGGDRRVKNREIDRNVVLPTPAVHLLEPKSDEMSSICSATTR